MPDGEMPQVPAGEMLQRPDGEKQQAPEGTISEWQEADAAGGQFGHFSGHRGGPENVTEQGTSPMSGGAAALIGISVLVLLAGILIAAKHR